MMEKGLLQNEANLQIKKIGSGLEMDSVSSQQVITTVYQMLLLVYSLILFIKFIKNDIKWKAATFLEFAFILLSSWTLLKFGYILTGCIICILGLLRHWNNLPQQQISAENKAILVTGKITESSVDK